MQIFLMRSGVVQSIMEINLVILEVKKPESVLTWSWKPEANVLRAGNGLSFSVFSFSRIY